MAIRIYALAKELKIESKDLIDACKAVGIAGKGSALASLTEEEVASVKSHLQGKPAAKPAEDVAEAPMMRPTAPKDRGRVRVLQKPAKPSPQEPTEAQWAEEPAEEPTVAIEEGAAAPSIEITATTGVEEEAEAAPEAPAAEEGPAVEETPSAPSVSVTATAPSGAVRREDYIGVHGGKMRDLSQKPRKEAEPAQEQPPKKPVPRKGAAPTIALAPMPAAPQAPAQKAKPEEPAPQKPEIRLSADALRSRPLAEHMRVHEEKQKRRETEKKGPGKPAAPAPGREAVKRRRGKGPEFVEEETATKEKEEAKRKRRRGSAAARRRKAAEEEGTAPPRQLRSLRRTRRGVSTAAPRKSNIVIQLPCTVRDFAQEAGVPAQKILGECMKLGTMMTINAQIDGDLAEMLAETFNVPIEVKEAVSLEERVLTPLEEREDAPESLQPRPPIVTFLGHVDHGKTSLLDRILDLDVVKGEKGGITQHIRAYRVHTEGGDVAFVDTPGHEAFTEMRARGANVTDIAVLVVAADDGVMPQTEEAISHARAAGVPIVVALNKCDLPGVSFDRALQSLAANELLPSEWGGDIEVVRTSAITGEGVDDLMDTLLTVAELHELKANPDRPATGVCIEAELQTGRGVMSKFLVQKGTLKVGDVVVCGSSYGRVKSMDDTLIARKRYEEVGPSTPVNLAGLDTAPNAGDRFYVLDSIAEARQIAEQRAEETRAQELVPAPSHVTLENLYDRLGGTEKVSTLNVILRADVRGSIEAIRKELTKLDHPEVQVKILQATVGGITEADVHLADASDAIIIGFSVVPDEGARILADRKGVQIRRYDIIYKLTEDLKAALEGMLKPEEREKELGRALVQRVFHISRVGSIAGCRVLAGTITRDARARLIRDSRIIGDYAIDSLKREKDDAKEVREGYECGIRLKGYNDIKEGDIFEAYKIEEVARTF